jgi:transcriptional regulator with XRE-family HTH domain
MMLKQWLKRTKTTQIAFAAKVNMAQGEISHIARRGTNSLRTALRIASATRNKVSPRELLPPEDIQ